MSFNDILKGLEARRSGKAAQKMPSWDVSELEFPSDLCLEQCSSEAAAMYKADVIKRLNQGTGLRIADLTGGLGVDSWAFSKLASAVFYNEMNPELHAAAQRNFVRLGAGNICCNNFRIGTDSSGWIDALTAFQPDWIYLDPARRDASGKKVFLLEDCSPDILTLLPTLESICPRIMVKLSPMADITMIASRLGGKLQEIHIVCIGGEVKELLCIMGPENCEDALIRVVPLGREGTFSFTRSQENAASAVICSRVGKYVLEPCAGILKSGAFKLVCGSFGIMKLSASTHLYTADTLPDGTDGLFKCFETVEEVPFGKAGFATVGKRYPHADVTSRGLPVDSDTLRIRLGIKPGPSQGYHVFGALTLSGRTLLVARLIRDAGN